VIEKFYVSTAAGQVHGRRVLGPGAPIVLLHRTPVSSESFEAVLNILDGRRTVIALDTPGFGGSFRPEGQPSTLDYARWMLDAIDALDIETLYIGAHHTGVHFAVEMAVLAPDRVQGLLLSGIIHAPPEERAKMRADIGQARPIDADGTYLTDCWKTMKGLFLDPVPALVHAETMGALNAIEGRDQAFDAILAQDFAAVFAKVSCPVRIAQATDDPLTLTGMLERVHAQRPEFPIERLGPAFLAAPERQAGAFARALIRLTEDPDAAMTDRRYQLNRTDTGYDLARVDQVTPLPGPDEVLVRVRAVSINRRDIGVRDLSYPVGGADGFTPLSDAAGEIVAVGPNVTEWKPGDRVTSAFFQAWSDGRLTLPAVLSSLGAGGLGVFADHVVLSRHGVVRTPDHLTDEEAACLPCAGVTAWNALMTLGRLQAGDWVLIIGTGGVALFALQIAVAAGARVIVLSSSDEKLGRAKAMGAEVGINYASTPDWTEAVKAASGGFGVQHVVELGGAGTLPKSLASLGLNGHLALIGALDGFGGQLDALPMIFAALRVSAVMVGSRADHEALATFMTQHQIRPVIDSVHDFDNAEAAYLRAAGGVFGKVVVRMESEA
jgi:NADPH:quinone reductase-like Zn-dependent oxidoreductase/pimeloyl-ACP methyl ester carboxylesterase